MRLNSLYIKTFSLLFFLNTAYSGYFCLFLEIIPCTEIIAVVHYCGAVALEINVSCSSNIIHEEIIIYVLPQHRHYTGSLELILAKMKVKY